VLEKGEVAEFETPSVLKRRRGSLFADLVRHSQTQNTIADVASVAIASARWRKKAGQGSASKSDTPSEQPTTEE
jgi:hypothetical protein